MLPRAATDQGSNGTFRDVEVSGEAAIRFTRGVTTANLANRVSVQLRAVLTLASKVVVASQRAVAHVSPISPTGNATHRFTGDTEPLTNLALGRAPRRVFVTNSPNGRFRQECAANAFASRSRFGFGLRPVAQARRRVEPASNFGVRNVGLLGSSIEVLRIAARWVVAMVANQRGAVFAGGKKVGDAVSFHVAPTNLELTVTAFEAARGPFPTLIATAVRDFLVKSADLFVGQFGQRYYMGHWSIVQYQPVTN